MTNFKKTAFFKTERCLALCCFIILMLTVASCTENKKANMDTPFVVVVKLKSAEQYLAYDEAEQYIDVVQVYSKLGSANPTEDWKQLLNFQYNLGRDKKFSNEFKYYDYDIEEAVTGNNATVCFRDKNLNSSITNITYGLEKRQNKWVVVSIEVEKRPDAK